MGGDPRLGPVVAVAVAAGVAPLGGRPRGPLRAADQPRARGLAEKATPLLGGLAIFAGAEVAGLLFLPLEQSRFQAVLAGAAVITLVGAVDDWRALAATWKLAGELLAALVLVLSGI